MTELTFVEELCL